MTDDADGIPDAAGDRRILVACFGNVLRGDDGFGNVVCEHLQRGPVPRGVEILEVGIGGIHLVQELLDGVDALVVVDAVDLDREPGTVVVLRPEIREVSDLTVHQRRDELADMHYATPDRALMLANAMDALPDAVWLVGGQVDHPEQLGEGLSDPLAGAVEPAIIEIRRLVSALGIPWSPDGPPVP